MPERSTPIIVQCALVHKYTIVGGLETRLYDALTGKIKTREPPARIVQCALAHKYTIIGGLETRLYDALTGKIKTRGPPARIVQCALAHQYTIIGGFETRPYDASMGKINRVTGARHRPAVERETAPLAHVADRYRLETCFFSPSSRSSPLLRRVKPWKIPRLR